MRRAAKYAVLGEEKGPTGTNERELLKTWIQMWPVSMSVYLVVLRTGPSIVRPRIKMAL